MVKYEKEQGWISVIGDGLSYLSRIVSASILPPIVESSEVIMKNIDERVLRIEKRILKKIVSLFIIGFGVTFLIFSLLFFLIEHAGWSVSVSFFSIGITIFVMGLLLIMKQIEK